MSRIVTSFDLFDNPELGRRIPKRRRYPHSYVGTRSFYGFPSDRIRSRSRSYREGNRYGYGYGAGIRSGPGSSLSRRMTDVLVPPQFQRNWHSVRDGRGNWEVLPRSYQQRNPYPSTSYYHRSDYPRVGSRFGFSPRQWQSPQRYESRSPYRDRYEYEIVDEDDEFRVERDRFGLSIIPKVMFGKSTAPTASRLPQHVHWADETMGGARFRDRVDDLLPDEDWLKMHAYDGSEFLATTRRTGDRTSMRKEGTWLKMPAKDGSGNYLAIPKHEVDRARAARGAQIGIPQRTGAAASDSFYREEIHQGTMTYPKDFFGRRLTNVKQTEAIPIPWYEEERIITPRERYPPSDRISRPSVEDMSQLRSRLLERAGVGRDFSPLTPPSSFADRVPSEISQLPRPPRHWLPVTPPPSPFRSPYEDDDRSYTPLGTPPSRRVRRPSRTTEVIKTMDAEQGNALLPATARNEYIIYYSDKTRRYPIATLIGPAAIGTTEKTWVKDKEGTIVIEPVESDGHLRDSAIIKHASNQTVFSVLPNNIGVSVSFSGETGNPYYYTNDSVLLVVGDLKIMRGENKIMDVAKGRNIVEMKDMASIMISSDCVYFMPIRGQHFLNHRDLDAAQTSAAELRTQQKGTTKSPTKSPKKPKVKSYEAEDAVSGKSGKSMPKGGFPPLTPLQTSTPEQQSPKSKGVITSPKTKTGVSDKATDTKDASKKKDDDDTGFTES